MSSPAAEPVASGKPYPITTVDGRRPASLSEFVGPISFTVRDGDRDRPVHGMGTVNEETVRFQEKDGAVGGKDVRCWQISRDADGFTAAHAPVY